VTTSYPTAGNLDAINLADGTVIPAHRKSTAASGAGSQGRGVTLAGGQSVAFVLDADAGCEHVHIKWDEVFAGVFTIETSSFDEVGANGEDDVRDWSATAGNWMQENPTVAAGNIPIVGGTVANLTVNVPGGTAGGCSIHIGNIGSRRARVKCVCTTGGLVRVANGGRISGGGQ
jgi:hypothetical protein